MRQLTQGLRFRISAAFLVVGVILSTLLVNAVEYVMDAVEARYVQMTLLENLDMAIAQQREGADFRLPYSTALRGYVVPLGEESALPPELRGFTPGLHEVETAEHEYQVAVRDHGNHRFVLAFDVTPLERIEDELDVTMAVGVVLFSLLSLWLGYWGSGRVIAPVRALAAEVRALNLQLPAEPVRLRGSWAKDEVGELARAFEQYARRLQTFVEREKGFTADVSHELRNPIMVASSSLDVLLERSGLDESVRGRLRRMQRAVQRMAELVDVFLTLARERRVEHTASEPELRIDVEEICHEVVSRYEDRARLKGLKVEIEVSGRPDAVGHESAARVVIDNLLSNAIRYTESGLIRIVVSEYGVDICDSGPGIPVEEASRIYERAFRGANASEGGFGLGLNIVQRLCEHNRWSVRLMNIDTGGAVARLQFSSARA